MPATDGVFPVVPRAAREAADRETEQENDLVSFTERLGQLPEVVAIAADKVQEDAVRRLYRNPFKSGHKYKPLLTINPS